MKILLEGAELFYADVRTDGQDEANSRNFSKAPKNARSRKIWLQFYPLSVQRCMFRHCVQIPKLVREPLLYYLPLCSV
jgi:hypothetical protein